MALDSEDLKKMIGSLGEELALVRADVTKIRKRLAWNSAYGFLKFLVIVLPLVVGYFYFQPQLQSLYQTWLSLSSQLNLLRGGENASQGMPAVDIDQLIKQYPGIVEQLRK